jgi:hypothetical protein
MAFSVISKSFHVFLTSDGCLKRFPQNRPNDFWVGLQKEKVLGNSHRWRVGLQNIHFDSDLYNFGQGTGVSFMFMHEDNYHVVHPSSEFVSTPTEAVEALNLALKKYCVANEAFFTQVSKRTEEGAKKPRLHFESYPNSQDFSVPDFSVEMTSQIPPLDDKDFDEEQETYNEISTALRREHSEKDDEALSSKLLRRQGSVDSGLKSKLKESGQSRSKRAVSEQTAKPAIRSKIENVEPIDPELLLKFFVDEKSGKIAIRVGMVKDFAMSKMMRLMLGFHSRKKTFQESFEFRKRCRQFFKTFNKKFDVVSAAEKEEVMLHPKQVRKSRPEDRDRFYITEFWGSGYDRFIDNYGDLLESELKSLISGYEEEYQSFVEKSYYPSRRGPMLTEKQRSLSFSIYSIIDFLYFVVAWTGIDGVRSKVKLLLKSDGNFKPNIFDRLYVYSNIVKPVDYDDKQIRLMDIVYLQSKNGGNYGVVDYRSVVFQEVDVDILKDIHIIITTSLGIPAPFMHGPMCLTLLFQREN